mmetsp:Transcript_42652/g.134497  ORF Transcript_42652/g.134497 Transcript_42652/m.134497 type:complete len:295 (-) Transcript_42652:171-1055(-)
MSSNPLLNKVSAKLFRPMMDKNESISSRGSRSIGTQFGEGGSAAGIDKSVRVDCVTTSCGCDFGTMDADVVVRMAAAEAVAKARHSALVMAFGLSCLCSITADELAKVVGDGGPEEVASTMSERKVRQMSSEKTSSAFSWRHLNTYSPPTPSNDCLRASKADPRLSISAEYALSEIAALRSLSNGTCLEMSLWKPTQYDQFKVGCLKFNIKHSHTKSTPFFFLFTRIATPTRVPGFAIMTRQASAALAVRNRILASASRKVKPTVFASCARDLVLIMEPPMTSPHFFPTMSAAL